MDAFTDPVPTSWQVNDDDLSARVTQQGRVHAGQSAVNLMDGAVLTQEVAASCGCFYAFSFFARGEGQQVGLTATLTFLTTGGPVTGLTITVRPQDLPNANREFAYYRGISLQAPAGTTAIRISFRVTATGGQSLDLDDVSLSVD